MFKLVRDDGIRTFILSLTLLQILWFDGTNSDINPSVDESWLAFLPVSLFHDHILTAVFLK